jgi:hypothetical protein
MFVIARVFLTGKPLHSSLMFVGKDRSLSYRGAPERCFTRVGLLTSIRIVWKGLPETNTVAYYEHKKIMAVKSSCKIGPLCQH